MKRLLKRGLSFCIGALIAILAHIVISVLASTLTSKHKFTKTAATPATHRLYATVQTAVEV